MRLILIRLNRLLDKNETIVRKLTKSSSGTKAYWKLESELQKNKDEIFELTWIIQNKATKV